MMRIACPPKPQDESQDSGGVHKVSISPTFYEQLFRTKDFKAAFLYLHCWFKLFGERKLAKKLFLKCW